MLRSIGVCLSVFVLTPLLAQTPPPGGDPPKLAHIEGKVVDGAGKPVRTADVRLARVAGNGQVPGLPGEATVSDNDGRFVFDIEPSPNLALTAQKAGYSQARYGAKAANAPVVMFGIGAGETLKDLVLTMVQQGVLTGRILDPAGEPLQGAQVVLLRRAYQQGVRRLASAGNAQTNDLGEFRLAGLTDGRYYLVARDRPGNQDRGNGVISLPTYYPNATEEQGAAPVDVSNGQQKSNLEIRLRTAKGYTVRGKVAGEASPSGKGVTNFVDAFPEAVASGRAGTAGVQVSEAQLRPDGAFELRNVIPGNYVLQTMSLVEAAGSATLRMVASAPVVVGEADVSGVILTPSPLYTITGKVSVEGATLAELFGTVVNTQAGNGTNATTAGATGMRLVFYPLAVGPLAQLGQLTQVTAMVGADGGFKLEGVQPGRYAFQQGTVQATSIQSVRWNDTDVTLRGLDVNGSGTLEVVYRRGAVRTTGTVKNAIGEPHGGAQIVMWPVDPLPVFNAQGKRNTTSDRLGAWNIGAVRPGSYYAVALEDIDANTAQVPELLEQLKALAQKVEAKEGSPLMLTLDLIPAETVQKALEKLP
jgi:protocatechuate 3,4-dioxygenase beta subunit